MKNFICCYCFSINLHDETNVELCECTRCGKKYNLGNDGQTISFDGKLKSPSFLQFKQLSCKNEVPQDKKVSPRNCVIKRIFSIQ